ncbi:uncharacterized protein KIAA2012 homolog isoform X29 [Mercenaria mercenaria]|uniref:uncharacterized protein KIAA2012 homolog isoform X29 n=1 Tax=Mercenaria mercenaria TaxID=6596 RepID=UPI00234F7C6A|nr:uncharacterized protein KIAA2012 homolog isoform X29 [Mercenaria mercenaria]
MATGSALNLSLLSRGVGEVTRNGSEKVDVIFEPQDYFNFVEESHDRPFFLPPLQPRYHGFTSEPSQLSSRYSSKDAVHLPKTFTTRKGALLLFSEDMAHRTKAVEAKKHRHQGFHSDRDITLSSLEESSTDRDLKTVDDLAKSILAYGSIDESGNMNLKVMAQRTKKRRYDFERQIRPGFSAKRYLSTWTKTWDDTTLEKVISKGYLTEKSLFYYNPLLPHLSRRLNDDLSHYPTPYKLMRSMLMSPGSLSGYTFYRVRPESQETDYIDISEDEEMRSLVKSRQAGSVKVASVTADGQLKEAIYGQLDRQAQAEVLTDLLVKGAVHYAMKTQQEFAGRILEESEGGSETKVVPKFDMRDAVESMLQANEQKGVPQQMLDADLPERDDRSQHSGSFKGSKLGSHRLHPRGQGDGLQWRDDASSASSGGAAPGPLPTSHAPLPPIGQTYTQLTPIGEASREHTQAFSLPVNEKDGVPQTADSMQPQIGIIPATPQTPAYSTEAQVGVKGVSKDPTFVLEAPEEVAEAFESEDEEGEDWVGRRMVEKPVEQKTHVDGGEEKRRMEMEKRKARVSARSLDLEGIQPKQFAGPPVAAGFSSSESAGPGSTHSSGWLPPVHKQQWKGSQQSLRSHGSRRASGSQVDGDAGSTKGSIIYGPDGSVIKVGETVKLSARASQQSYHDVHDTLQPGLIDASDDSDAEVPNEWKLQGRQTDIKKLPKRESPKSRVTEQEIIDKLTSHATHIAESVLSHSESGQLLEEDIRRAAALWMDTHPPRDISRSQSVQDLPDTYVGLRITRLHVMTVIQEVMKVQKRNSAGPTVAEYRDQIKGNLMTALAKATGLKQSDIPQDAEIDPELLEQLASNTLTPDDIEIVRDEETGRSFIRSRNRIITEAMGGVEKGHIYQPAAKKTVQWLNVPTSGDYTHWSRTDGEGGKRVSIPSERKPAEIGELDIITYQGQDDDKQSPKGSKAGSEVGSKKASSGKPKSVSHDGDAKSIKSAASFKDSQGQDELQKALADLEQGGSPTDAHSLKSGKSGKTQKSDDKKSKVSEKKGPSPEKEKKEEFVVGKVQNKKELEELYSQPVHAPEPKESVLAENSIVKDKKEKSMKEKSVVKKSAQSQKSKLSMASKEKTDVKVQKKPKTPATKAKPKSKPDKEPEPDKVEVKVEEPTKTEPAKEVEQKIEPNVLKEKEPPAKDVTAGTRKPKTPAKNTKPKVKIDKGHDQAEVKTETAKKVDKKIEPNVLKEEEPPFKDVTGKPKEKKQTKAAPVGKKKPEKGKKPKGKGKKKEEPAPEPETAMEAVSPVKEKTPEPPKEKTPKSQTPVSERPDNIDTSVNQSTINTSTVITESAKQESDEEEEYIIVRDETMSPEIEQPDVHLNMTTSAEEEEPDEEQPLLSTRSSRSTASSKRSEADKLRMISNREARAAKRAAAAEKRRQEVERKRKEREEQIKREKEEHERQEVLRQEQEELRKQKEEERRLKKQREEEENEEQMQEELERQRREKAEVEKERRRKEEYARKLEMMKVKQAEEEKRRQEEAERKRLEEEERRKEEEELMAKMAEEERLEYERKKKLEEEERIRKEEEEKKRREEEAQRALEEARRLAEEMARKQAELEARLRFNRSLQMEANGLEHTQDITKAFVFSYFELLQWLGLDIPEFELLKLNQY